jgi:hypothetical protein
MRASVDSAPFPFETLDFALVAEVFCAFSNESKGIPRIIPLTAKEMQAANIQILFFMIVLLRLPQISFLLASGTPLKKPEPNP